MYVTELGMFLTMKVLENKLAVLSLWTFTMKTDSFMNGSTITNHISFRRDSDTLQHGEVRSYRGSSLVNEFCFWFTTSLKQERPCFLQACRFHQRQQHQVTVRLVKERIKVKVTLLPCLCHVSMLMIEQGNPFFPVNPITSKVVKSTKNVKKQNIQEIMIERKHPLFVDLSLAISEILEWLQEFRENLRSAQSKKRQLCCIFAIMSGWKLKGKFHEILFLSSNHSRPCVDVQIPYERRFGQPIKEPIILFTSLVEYHFITAKDQSGIHSIWKQSLTWIVSRIRSVRGRNLKGSRTGCRSWWIANDGRIRNILKKNQCERDDMSKKKMRNSFCTFRMDESKSLEEIHELRTYSLVRHRPIQRGKFYWLSWKITKFSSNTSRLISRYWWNN